MPYGTDSYGNLVYGYELPGTVGPPPPPPPPLVPNSYDDGNAYDSGFYDDTGPTPPPPDDDDLQIIINPTIFQTPKIKDEPPFLPDSSPLQMRLFRHYENRWRQVNVWQRSDGTFVQDTPTPYESSQTSPAAFFSDDPVGPYEIIATTADVILPGTYSQGTWDAGFYDGQIVSGSSAPGQTDSNVNYPWNPFPGSGPEDRNNPGQFVHGTNWDGTTFTDQLNPYMSRWFQPAASNVVTQAEALVLTAAGYGDCLS